MSKPDSRSEIYFFAFDTHSDKSITATGVQFVTQTIPGPCDEVSFSTLKKAADAGHLMPLIKCSPHYAIIQELAALPDKITKLELTTKFAAWRKRAKTIL